jgi:hypothetical protein
MRDCNVVLRRHLVGHDSWLFSATVRPVTDPELGSYTMVYDSPLYDSPLYDSEDEALRDAQEFADWKGLSVAGLRQDFNAWVPY